MNYLFPLTYLVNGLATTFLLIGLGLAGNSLLAADVGLVQGATLATFYAFSGNARSLILNPSGERLLAGILAARLLLALPLSGFALLLGLSISGVGSALALALVLRRCAESFSEVQLSVLERMGRSGSVLRHLLAQAFLLGLALVSTLAQWSGWLWVWYGWALFPLMAAWPVLSQFRWPERRHLAQVLGELFPHIGSTAIIGISIYAFRLLILLLVGRSLAGDLYTAFALGSFVGSVFANVLGPSLLWHQTRTGQRPGSWLESLVIPLLVLAGTGLLGLGFAGEDAATLGRAAFFWQALGFSLLGGAVMLLAQRMRLVLLQEGSGVKVFGADMMINLLLLAAVPFGYTLFGKYGLTSLHLLNALLCLLFYSSTRSNLPRLVRQLSAHRIDLAALTAAIVLAPIFLQLGAGIYRSVQPMVDSGGLLLAVPLPLSVGVTVLAILAYGRYRRAQLSLATLFVLFLGMLLATIVSTSGELQAEKRKLLLLLQFLVPVFGLVLGQMMGAANWRPIAIGFLLCLWVVVPTQLAASWLQGEVLLSHDLGLLGIYQHRQYVPVMLVAAFLVAWASLRNQAPWHKAATYLAPLMGVYAVASTSVLAVLALCLGITLFTYVQDRGKLAGPALVSLLLATLAYFAVAIQSPEFNAKFDYESNSTNLLPDSFLARILVWGEYLGLIAGDVSTIAFGHARPPERWISTGAHNYYLDFLYHFGVFALLPLVYLAWFTGQRLWQARHRLSGRPEVLMLSAVVLFLLVADNTWKVALRQPYSGILAFYLWGLLLARLERWRMPATTTTELSAVRVSHAH